MFGLVSTLWNDQNRVINMSINSDIYYFFMMKLFKIPFFQLFEMHRQLLSLVHCYP